jgi:hypothetical protein
MIIEEAVSGYQPLFQLVGLALDIVGFAVIAREWFVTMQWQRDQNTVDRANGFLTFKARGNEQFQAVEAAHVERVIEVTLRNFRSVPLDQTTLGYADLATLIGRFYGPAANFGDYLMRRSLRTFKVGAVLVIFGFIGQFLGSWPLGAAPAQMVQLPFWVTSAIIMSASFFASAIMIWPSNSAKKWDRELFGRTS